MKYATLQLQQPGVNDPYGNLAGEISYEQTFKDAAIDESTACYERTQQNHFSRR
jgi:hypothetical protein